jgi:hypothetical protein
MDQTQFKTQPSFSTSTAPGVGQQARTPRIIEYKGIQIVYLDYSNIKKIDDIFSFLDKAGAFIRSHQPNSIYTLTNLEGMHFNNEIFNRFIAYVKANNPHVKASAVVGMGGMMQIFYNTFTKVTGRNVRAFSSDIEAKEYLVSFK